jgi:hypothetical protein
MRAIMRRISGGRRLKNRNFLSTFFRKSDLANFLAAARFLSNSDSIAFVIRVEDE